MEKIQSDDSFETTDEGDENEKEEEEPLPEPLTEKEGDIIKIKDEHIIKIINKVGIYSDKPIESDNAVLISHCYYIDIDTKDKVNVPLLCEFDKETEINLKDEKLPRSYALGVSSMRIKEEATLKIKFKYIFKHLLKAKKFFEDKLRNLYDESFQKRYENEKFICNVKLVNFFIIQNLMDKGEIRKKILKRSNERKMNYAKNGDIVRYNMRYEYKGKEIYNKVNKTSELDKEFGISMFEIERRILENVKIGEQSTILVEPSYMTYKNQDFLKKYSIDNNEPSIFHCEVFDFQRYEYVLNISKDKISKYTILHKGFGKESPDREMSVKFKLQIRIDNKIIYNTFEEDDISTYITSNKYTEELMEWRDNINKEYGIEHIDNEVDFIKNGEIYKKLIFNGLIDADLQLYTLPNVIRKVIVHMKRNEITYIKTSHIDYFTQGDFELNNIGKLNCDEGQPKIEIYIHLYDFLQVPLFAKYSYEAKYDKMKLYKTVADECFKKGKFFQAMKIYNSINYRFDGGDIFGHDQKNAEDYLKEKDNDLFEKLAKMRLATHNNYALCKMRLGKIDSCYKASKIVLDKFDNKNPKALFLYGKCSLALKKYKQAVDTLKLLNDIQKGNPEAEALLKEAEKIYNEDIGKSRKMYKKMFKHSD